MVQLAKNTAGRIVSFFASYGLATVLFLLLLLLTFLGTLEQIENGLHETQQKYFESLYLVHHFFGKIPVVLPGAYLVLGLLTINLVVGGFLRMRKGVRQIGVLTAHGGILLLVAWAFVTYHYAIDGHMTLYEGEQADTFQSYHEWEIALTEAATSGPARQLIISGDSFQSSADPVKFTSSTLPFVLTVDHFYENASMMPKGPMFEVDTPVIDGMFLQPQPANPQNERNIAGAYITVTDKDTGAATPAILWAMRQTPAVIQLGSAAWHIDLRRKTWQLPFTIVLNKFTRELHPRTNMPRVFMSQVTKVEDGVEQGIQISMNEPLRHEGYTLFQASWGPQDAAPGDRLFSTFAVVRNPADQFPLYACIVIAFGLLLHFSMKLFGYLQKESRRRA